MIFQCINIRQVPWEVLKTAASGLGFQHLPRDLANVMNAWKTMFNPYNNYNVVGGWYTDRHASTLGKDTEDGVATCRCTSLVRTRD